MLIRHLQQVPWQQTASSVRHLVECFPYLGPRVSHSCLLCLLLNQDADVDAVYNNLNYHWATSLLGFLTLAMTPFP